MFAVSVLAVLAAAAIPHTFAGLDRARGMAGARHLASRMAYARSLAVMRSVNVAFRFDGEGDGLAMQLFVDGNQNGIRTKEITAGVDRPLGPPERLGDVFQGVRIAMAPDVSGNPDPVRFGNSSILTFTPLGTASPGSVYVLGHDGSQYAIRVFGATGRTRVLRFVPRTGEWAAE